MGKEVNCVEWSTLAACQRELEPKAKCESNQCPTLQLQRSGDIRRRRRDGRGRLQSTSGEGARNQNWEREGKENGRPQHSDTNFKTQPKHLQTMSTAADVVTPSTESFLQILKYIEGKMDGAGATN